MRSRIFSAALCKIPAHSISFSSVMVMDGPDGSLEHYLEGLRGNARAIIRGFGAEGNP